MTKTTKLLPVKEAIRIIEEKTDYRFHSSFVDRVSRTRTYYFQHPKAVACAFNTATLRVAAEATA